MNALSGDDEAGFEAVADEPFLTVDSSYDKFNGCIHEGFGIFVINHQKHPVGTVIKCKENGANTAKQRGSQRKFGRRTRSGQCGP